MDSFLRFVLQSLQGYVNVQEFLTACFAVAGYPCGFYLSCESTKSHDGESLGYYAGGYFLARCAVCVLAACSYFSFLQVEVGWLLLCGAPLGFIFGAWVGREIRKEPIGLMHKMFYPVCGWIISILRRKLVVSVSRFPQADITGDVVPDAAGD